MDAVGWFVTVVLVSTYFLLLCSVLAITWILFLDKMGNWNPADKSNTGGDVKVP